MNRLFIFLAVCLLGLIAVSAIEVDVSVRIGGGHNHQDSEPAVHELADAAGEEVPDAQTEGPSVPIVGAGAPDFNSIESIKQLAASSSCAKINWNNRGRSPAGYIKGIALTWAKAVCNPTRPDVVAVGAAVTTNVRKDALAQYASIFRAAGMDNSVSGLDTARHAYTLLIGLGMRESSGKHCCGRDMSAHFTKSETAEAGVFQTSYGSRVAYKNILEPMFQKYVNNQGGNCFLDTFKEGAKCGTNDWKNWGTGNGAQWQTLTKQCPAFATEWGSALLRTNGGSAGEWGPLRRREAQLKPECDSMLKQVQTIVQQHPNLCKQLN